MPSAAGTNSQSRIVLLDSGLRQRTGHHAHFACGLARLCVKNGFSLATLTTKSVDRALAAELADHRGVFTRGLYEPAAEGDLFDRTWNDYRAGQRLCAADLDRSGFEPRPSDLFWMPVTRAREVAGVADWLLKLGVRPRVAIGFQDLYHPVEPGSVQGLIHRLAARRVVQAVGQEQVFAHATNHRLAQRLAAAMNFGIHLVPQTLFYDPSAPAAVPPTLPAGNGPLVACLGVPRPEKSGLPLPDIVHEALRQRADLRFVIQVNGAKTNAALMALERMPQVQLVKGWLDDGAFVALIQAADMLLLPYRRDRYAERTSGPFSFAAAYGRPAIVPSGTWMAERIARKQAAGIAYKRDAAVIDALTVAADRLPDLHSQAARLAQRWRIWDGEALLRVVRRWAAGDGTGELRRVDPKPPSV
ncbi:glycosyltransferase family protein [Hypericibacter terrae]|uniref:glycosyltransferase n=1 Tax=Hypericibacter terrae TaxID=2602015 RepID=UPI0012464E2E|nr:glycosyltransferase [Hypericibacter terrae]